MCASSRKKLGFAHFVPKIICLNPHLDWDSESQTRGTQCPKPAALVLCDTLTDSLSIIGKLVRNTNQKLGQAQQSAFTSLTDGSQATEVHQGRPSTQYHGSFLVSVSTESVFPCPVCELLCAGIHVPSFVESFLSLPSVLKPPLLLE